VSRMTLSSLIDVWNIATFDVDLRSTLANSAELIRSYMCADREIEAEHQSSDHVRVRRNNVFAVDFLAFQEGLIPPLNERSIRAWHYTRLTNPEVFAIQRDGIELSTLESIRRRLDALIEAGNLNPSEANAIFDASPFKGSQHDARTGKFWMTSHPLPLEDFGITSFMTSWGGESAFFWQRDKNILEILNKIGAPRVIEVSVPLKSTRHAYSASVSIVSTFSRSLGCNPEKSAFDLYSTSPLPPASILRMHSEGDETFAKIAKGYPEEFVDVDIGRWDHF
jgi:hypothetical protein